MLNFVISRLIPRLTAALEAAARHLSDLYAVVQDAHAAAARFESLVQMSDAELARRGLKREGLAQAVFAAEA
jgi:hypothetical protein